MYVTMNVNTSGVIECAKEELEILEMQYPNRFEYLKKDLKDFISDFQSNNNPPSISTCPSLHTQESSNRKKRKKGSSGGEEEVGHANGFGKKRSKTDAILHRAQQCLRKIQQFKTSF